MPWNVPLFSSVAFLLLLQGPKINGVSQELVYVIECIKNMIPMQIFDDCCVREHNCSVTKQQNEGIDCMSRMIMSNHSHAFSDASSGEPMTTDMPFQYHNREQQSQLSHADALETLNEICRREPKGKLQACIRNELIKRCRFSMLQDRITSPPGRWEDRDYGSDGYGDWNDGAEPRRRSHQPYGNRRQKVAEYQYGYSQNYDDSRLSQRGNRKNDNMDEEDIRYFDGDSGYKNWNLE